MAQQPTRKRSGCTARDLASAFHALQTFHAKIVNETVDDNEPLRVGSPEVEIEGEILLNLDNLVSWMKNKMRVTPKGSTSFTNNAPFNDAIDATVTPASISNFPEDILRIILLENAVGAFWSMKSRAFSTRAFSQVCKTWRGVAFNCPSVWSNIIDYMEDSTAWIDELLKRSEGSSIYIQRDEISRMVDLIKRPDVAELVIRNVQRWRNVSFRIDSFPSTGVSQLRLANPAIESLELFYLPMLSLGRLDGVLFSDNAPRFRSLSLFNMSLDFGRLPRTMHALTDLKICQGQLLTLSEWLAVLRNTPALKSLQLDGAFAHQSQYIFSNISVALPHLSVFYISSAAPNICKTLFESLFVPPNCGLVLEPKDVYTIEDAYVIADIIKQRVDIFVFSAKERFLQAYFSLRMFDIVISNLDVSNLRRSSEVADDIRCGAVSSVDAPIHVRFSELLHLSPYEKISLLSRLITGFGPTYSTTTSFRLLTREYDATLLRNLNPFSALIDMTGLKRLEIVSSCYKWLFSLLRGVIPGRSRISLPSLELIHFHSSLQGSLEPQDIVAIEEFLLWRKEKGHPIPAINIYNCVPCYLISQSSLSKIVHLQKEKPLYSPF